MEVVVLSVSKESESRNGMDKGHRRWLVAEIAVLVSLQQTLGLGLRCGSSGKPLVEVHDLGHANSIW